MRQILRSPSLRSDSLRMTYWEIGVGGFHPSAEGFHPPYLRRRHLFVATALRCYPVDDRPFDILPQKDRVNGNKKLTLRLPSDSLLLSARTIAVRNSIRSVFPHRGGHV